MPRRSPSKSFLQTLVLAVAIAVVGSASAQEKVVFQVTDDDVAKWNLTLNNVRNLQTAVGPEGANVEVVAYGPGIQLLKAGSPIAARITEAVGNNVKVMACQNTMAANNLVEQDMLRDIGYVPSGVVEVMRKQQQGYAYIRP